MAGRSLRWCAGGTDDLAQLAETNERDNSAYAYVEVRGDDVRVLERGYGQDPWEPHKHVARDLLPPTPLSSVNPLA